MSAHLSDRKSDESNSGAKSLIWRAWAHPYGRVLIPATFALLMSQIAFSLGQRVVSLALAAPVAIYFGLAFAGHLMTIDDDMPGEWSNPGRSRSLWRRSLLEMFVKFVLFLVVAIYVSIRWEA